MYIIKIVFTGYQVLHSPKDHTAANLATGIRDALNEWGLSENKMSGISTDNASNIVKACGDEGKQIPNDF